MGSSGVAARQNICIGASGFAQDWTFASYQVLGNGHMLEPTNTNGISCVLAGAEGVLLVDVISNQLSPR